MKWDKEECQQTVKILNRSPSLQHALAELGKTFKRKVTEGMLKGALQRNGLGGVREHLAKTEEVAAPRILLIDIETSPNLSYTWGRWEQNVIAFKQEWQLLSFAYKELGKKQIYCISRPQFKDQTDLSITKAIWDVLNAADIVIGHNGDSFDVPKLRAKFVEHGLMPPTPFKTIDTKKIAKSQFMFNGNSLNDLAFTLKLGQKKQTGGFELWLECLDGDPKAWKKMIDYNKWDVLLLERVYERLKAWYPTHPNLALHMDKQGCPVCYSASVVRSGYHVMKLRKSARFNCRDCGHWFSRALPKGGR